MLPLYNAISMPTIHPELILFFSGNKAGRPDAFYMERSLSCNGKNPRRSPNVTNTDNSGEKKYALLHIFICSKAYLFCFVFYKAE